MMQSTYVYEVLVRCGPDGAIAAHRIDMTRTEVGGETLEVSGPAVPVPIEALLDLIADLIP